MTLSVPAIEPGEDVLSAALRYASAGWYVLPVDPTTKHAGSRVGKGWPAASSREPKVIVAWFAGSSDSLALHVGRSGAIAFDVDKPEALPPILLRYLVDGVPHQSTRAETPGRGHWIFLQPPGRMLGNSGGKLGTAWGEMRGRNGIVVVAPSRHSGGGRYAWIRTGPVPMLPARLAAALPDSTTPQDAAADAEVLAFLDEHTRAARPGLLRAVLARWDSEMRAGASRHMTAWGCLVWALKEARAGYYPAQLAHDELQVRFLGAMAISRDHRERVLPSVVAGAEWAGLMAYAVPQAKAADLTEVRRLVETAPLRAVQRKAVTA